MMLLLNVSVDFQVPAVDLRGKTFLNVNSI